MTKKKDKIYAFIDSQNLNLGVRSQKWKLDFEKFRVYLKDKYNVDKAFLFLGFIPTNTSLYTDLQQYGYVIIFKPVLQSKRGKNVIVKGNVDAELVLHSMIEFKNYDKSVIVTGDGDFHCLIEYLEKNNKLEKIIVPNKKYSSLLRKFAPYILNIDQLKKKLKQ